MTVGEPHADVVVIGGDHPSTSSPPRVLVTNDDGIDSPGLRLLAASLAETMDVIVVAPRDNHSGAGTALGRFDPIAGVALTKVDLDGVDSAFSVDGPPGLAVLASWLGAFGPIPDLVVSGINAGMNTGHSVIHSGTVGAALTARTLGGRGLAVSLQASNPWRWETAIEVTESAARWLLAQDREQLVLNLNVPAVPIADVRGIHWADLDDFGHLRVATADVVRGRLEFEVRTGATRDHPGSDTSLCRDGFVSATLLSTIEPMPFPPEPAANIWPGPSGSQTRR